MVRPLPQKLKLELTWKTADTMAKAMNATNEKATMSTVDDGQYCASVEVSLRFIRPASEGDLIAEAAVVKRGRSIAHLEARVHDGDDRLVATGSGTFAILGG